MLNLVLLDVKVFIYLFFFFGKPELGEAFSAVVLIFTAYLDVVPPPPRSFQPCKAQKSKSAKACCCSADRLEGLGGGDRTGWSRVNSLSKLLTSPDSLIDGRNGGFAVLVSRASQSIVWMEIIHKSNQVSAVVTIKYCLFILIISE